MVRSVCLGCFVLFAGVISAPAADPVEVKTGFDLVPITAAAGFTVHNLTELQVQGDAFVKNTEMEKQIGLRPSQLVPMIFGYLGLNQGRDDTVPAAILVANLFEARVLNPSDFRSLEQLLVVAVGFTDRDKIAANFGLAKGELKPEKIMPIRRENQNFGRILYVQGNHLYLGNNERAILSVANGKRLSQALSKEQMQRLSRSDMLLHLGTSPWGAGWVQFVQGAKDRAEALKDKEADPDTGLSPEVMHLIADSLPAVQNMLVGVAIDEKGFEFQTQTIFRPEEHLAAQKLLALLRGGEKTSSLNALPQRNLVASQAVRSDGSQNRALVRALLEFCLDFWINEKKLAAMADRPEFVGLFDEVWQRLKGSQLAIYHNDDPAKQGLFSMLAILDTAEPEEFLSEMRQLSRFAKSGELKLDGDDRQPRDVATVEKLIEELGDRNFRVRQSATLKLSLIGPPALPYLEKAATSNNREIAARARLLKTRIENTIEARRDDVMSQSLLRKLSARWGDFPKAETRRGVPIDIVKMDLEGESKGLESQLQDAFGPEWSKIRLAVHGKKIVVLMGSNVELLEETLANLENQKPGLTEHEALQEFHTRAPEDRRTEFHLILRQFVPLVKGDKAGEVPTSDMTSLSLGIGKDTIELHLWVPNQEFRTLSRF